LDSDKELDAELKGRTLAHIRKVCGRYGVVPRSYVLAGVAIEVFKTIEECEDYNKIKAVRQAAPTMGSVVVSVL